jgi:hypothetical protein
MNPAPRRPGFQVGRYFEPSECGLFASKSVGAHVVRGAVAAVLIGWAVVYQTSHPVFAIGALVVAVVAMRGCPMCWTVGLFETIGRRWSRGRKSNTGSSPALRGTTT